MDLDIITPQTGDGGFTLGEATGIGHRNLARDFGSEVVINKTKDETDPFTTIRKTPSYTPNGNLTGYGIELYHEGQGHELVGTVSENYLLIPNGELFEVGKNIMNASGHDWAVRRIFFDGGRFAAIFDFKDVTAELEGRDKVGLSLVLRNSYNGTWPVEASLMAIDFFCENGLLTGQFFENVRFKHSGEKDWSRLIEQGMGVLEGADRGLDRFVAALSAMRKVNVDYHVLQRLLAPGDGLLTKGSYGLGTTEIGKVVQRFVSAEEPTLHGLMSAGTNVFWHDRSAFTSTTFNKNKRVVDTLIEYALESQN